MAIDYLQSSREQLLERLADVRAERNRMRVAIDHARAEEDMFRSAGADVPLHLISVATQLLREDNELADEQLRLVIHLRLKARDELPMTREMLADFVARAPAIEQPLPIAVPRLIDVEVPVTVKKLLGTRTELRKERHVEHTPLPGAGWLVALHRDPFVVGEAPMDEVYAVTTDGEIFTGVTFDAETGTIRIAPREGKQHYDMNGRPEPATIKVLEGFWREDAISPRADLRHDGLASQLDAWPRAADRTAAR